MRLYFLFIHIAAFFGHRKARLLVNGQKEVRAALKASAFPALTSPVVWIHAASVGEFEQARPFIERWQSEHRPGSIVVTFFSPSGYEARKDFPLADRVLYLPFATRRNARLFLDVIHPDIAIFVKYEFWPAYLRELKRRNIPTYLISAIFTPDQLFFKPWGITYRRLLNHFTTLFVQDEASKALLRSVKSPVIVAGDTRFDRVIHIAKDARTLPVVEHFIQGSISALTPTQDRIIVAGSTWPQDEAFLARYMSERDGIKLILVPHETDEAHLHHIFQLFRGRYVHYTEATPMNVLHVSTLVVDTMGLLSTIYRYGHVAYIGGGFGVGIHNTLEPAVYGMPVLFGPNYDRFREAKGLIAAGAAQSFKTYADFVAAMDNALENYTEMGAKAKAYIDSELGATNKIFKLITEN